MVLRCDTVKIIRRIAGYIAIIAGVLSFMVALCWLVELLPTWAVFVFLGLLCVAGIAWIGSDSE